MSKSGEANIVAPKQGLDEVRLPAAADPIPEHVSRGSSPEFNREYFAAKKSGTMTDMGQELPPPGDVLAKPVERLIGATPWNTPTYRKDTVNGVFGCALLASADLGLRIPTVGALQQTLRRRGWERIEPSKAREHDMVFVTKGLPGWERGGGKSHVGVVTAGGEVVQNRWNPARSRFEGMKTSMQEFLDHFGAGKPAWAWHRPEKRK